MLGINVIYELKPGQRQDFLDCLEAAGIRAAVLAEPGCLKYDFYCSVDNPDELLLVEKWTDREVQAIHLKQPRMNGLRELKDRFVADSTVELFDL